MILPPYLLRNHQSEFMAHHITNLLKKFIPSEHSWKVVLFEKWPSIIGSLKGKVRIERVDGATLILGVCHPAWAQELYILSPMLKKKINELFAQERIKIIRFKTVSFKAHGAKKEKKEAQKNTAHEQPLALDAKQHLLLQDIKDEMLRAQLERFGIRCKSKKINKKGEV